MAGIPIDPAISTPIAVAGRVVTMDALGTVLDAAVVYARDGSITAVLPQGIAPPAGFENVPPVQTSGTIYPGLIELHNHLPYDVLALWNVPKQYGDRDQWSSPATPDYHRLITGPMSVLGRNDEVVPAIVRYVELRCLLGGTTTSQGVSLASSSGIVKHFRGLVRNIESTGDPDLPAATTHIADVDAADAEHFLARISGRQKIILHLAEGTDAAARRHFQALQFAPGRWAISPNLVGIHCVALTADDFAIFAEYGGSMVWSPLSNLLLYGKTADVSAALDHGVPVALGSDWSPSGSKNLLGELKVAQLAAQAFGIGLSSADLVTMVTTAPARLLGWQRHLGSIEPGKRADLIVVAGASGDSYDQLVRATESDIDLVMINGVPRAGTASLMSALGLGMGERLTVGGRQRVLNLAQATADPLVEALSAADAISRLEHALAALGTTRATLPALAAPPRRHVWLAVDGLIDNHMSPRPHLMYRGRVTGPNFRGHVSTRPANRPTGPLPALTLDPLTAVDNPAFYDAINAERNVPSAIRQGLVALKPK